MKSKDIPWVCAGKQENEKDTENKEKIRCLSLGSGSIAVDYPKDVEKVENILKGRF